MDAPLPGALSVISSMADHQGRRLGNWQSDDAVDLAAPKGTDVLAVTDGEIASAYGFGLASGGPTVYGHRLHLIGAHDKFSYTHMAFIARGVVPGARIT